MSVREQVHRHESADCQSEGNGYVPRSIRSAGEDRHYSHEIVHQYEEEGGEQIRGVFPAVVSGNGRFYDIIVDECYHRFQNGRYPCRGFVQHIVFPVPARASEYKQHHYQTVYHQSGHVFRDGDIQRTDFIAGGILFDYLSVIFSAFGAIQPFIRSFFQFR